MKCKFCNTAPQKKEYWKLPVRVDKRGNFRIVEGEKVCHRYYECECGMRYSPSQVEA